MSEQLPYDDELLNQLNDLPLPNEDMAWEDMRHRLEKDDDDGPVIPPVLKGCGGYALLLVVLVIAFLFIVDPLKWFHDKTKIEPDKTVVIKNKNVKHTDTIVRNKMLAVDKGNNKIIPKDSILTSGIDTFNKKNIPVSQTGDNVQVKEIIKKSSQSDKNHTQNLYTARYQKNKKNYSFNGQNDNDAVTPPGIEVKKYHSNKTLKRKTGGRLSSTISGTPQTDSVVNDPPTINQTEDQPSVKASDSTATIVLKKKTVPDSIKIKAADTTAYKKKSSQDSSKENHLHFSAGLAIHQLLPVAGQKTNPYNSLGRKSSLGDYVPSVYVRMYKDKKWFLQSEFRYGAAQYTKQVVFSQKKIVDSSVSTSVISTNSTVKKTFYHQLPISFNYFVLPDLSVGLGITFNKFRSALVQQDVYKASPINLIDTLVSTGLLNQKKADSNFVTTYMQALIETQYNWRRFSIGARYCFGIQPYLKFKLPGGEERKERNSSLQLFIRYEIWRSKKD